MVIGLLGVLVARRSGTQESIRDAKQIAGLAGRGIVEPDVGAGVLAGRRAALRRLDEVVRARVLHEGIFRVKIWTPHGRIVYSDEPRLIGARYDLEADERAVLRRGGVKADISDLARPENRFERPRRKVLEVYLPIRSTTRRPLLFESYQRFSSVSAGGRRLWLAFAPAFLGGLLLLQLVNVPLGRSLARRLRRGQEEREALLRRALDASQTERRTIAADLHDGVVQDLIGTSYALAAEAERLGTGANGAARTALAEGAARARSSVRALRTLLVDIYPPSLHRAGLAAALEDLAQTATSRGLPTELRCSGRVELGADSERLLFRCAQEALRNAVRHADAREAHIDVDVSDGRTVLRVADDGRGFVPENGGESPGDPHLGLRLLAELVQDADGALDVVTAPGAGTTVRVSVPR